MAGRYDPNPFDEEEANPFIDPAERSKASGQSKYSGSAFNTTGSLVLAKIKTMLYVFQY